MPTSLVRRPTMDLSHRRDLAQDVLHRLTALGLVQSRTPALIVAGVRMAEDREAFCRFLERRPLAAQQVLYLLSSAFTEASLAKLLEVQLEGTHFLYLEPRADLGQTEEVNLKANGPKRSHAVGRAGRHRALDTR